MGTVRFGNDLAIRGYGDYQFGNVMISQVYFVERLGHNLFSVGPFCDSDLEVAFRKHTCYVHDLEGKSKKHTHKPKSGDFIQEKLYLLHMDRCGLIRIESINRETYILVIVGDYSRHCKPGLDIGECDRTRVESSISTPYVPSTKNDWDLLFQPMFDEYFNPPPSVVSPVPAVAAPRPADLTDSPLSTSIDQAAPSVSTSSTIQETQSLVNSEGVEEQLQPAQLVDDPFLDVLTSEPSSHE
ncbi:hypothetical protein Tco_1345148 [Tanacetum coccineum]